MLRMASGLGAGPCYVPCKRHTPPRPGLHKVEVIFIPISKKRKWRPEGLNSLCEVTQRENDRSRDCGMPKPVLSMLVPLW